jgi:MFS family permease
LWGWITSEFGWQIALISVGASTLLVALVLNRIIDEPPRPASTTAAKTSFIANIKTLYRVRSYRHMVLAFAITGIGAMGGVQWHPTFLARIHDMDMATIGISLALISGGVGTVSAVLSGRLGSYFSKRDVRAPMWICAVGVLVAAPLFVGAYLVISSTMSLLLLIAASLFGYVCTPQLFTVTQSATPLALRAFAAGVAMAIFTGLGMAVGVPLIGAISDLMTANYGASGLRYALASIAIFYIWAAVHYVLAARHYDQDLQLVNQS